MSTSHTDPPPPENPGGSSPPLLRTPLHDEHAALGAVLIDFNGWEMPVRYTSIPEEHAKVRLAAGLFDLCHMGRLEMVGRDAARWLQHLITNDYDAMRPGDARYTLFLNEEGTILDDAIVYKLPEPHAAESILIVVNASNRARIVDWAETQRGSLETKLGQLDAQCIDRTGELGMVAIQGPESARILPEALDEPDAATLAAMKYYSITAARAAGKPAWVARTGYTGEDGFEVYLEAAETAALWRRLLEAGGEHVKPIGLGARDTLRLEAGMPLYGHEIDLTTDPFEAGLDFAVKLKKAGGFIGIESLLARRERGPRRKLSGFRVEGRRVARQGMKILRGEEEVGLVTSGAPSPTLGCPIAMGYLSTAVGDDERGLTVDIRGHREPITAQKLPFYSRTRKKAGTGTGTGRNKK